MAETMDSSTQTYEEPEFGPGSMTFPSPRVQIDTSAPFGSVEEAVIRFGGRGYWIPDMFQSAPHSSDEEVDIGKLEEQAAEMLKDLDTKQKETLGILKELELTKRLIEELKQKLHNEPSGIHLNAKKDTAKIDQTDSIYDSPNFFPLSPAGLVMLELKQAKQNLSQSTSDLESIRSSVEHVNKKMEKKKKIPLKRESLHTEIPNPLGISRELRELNNEAEQFMKTAEAAKAEVLKAMSEVEQTKTGLKMIEMRWVAAKKLEEAAKATEALALAEIKALSSNEATSQQRQSRISLSLDEYYALAEKARKAENLEEPGPRRLNRNDVPQFRNLFWSQRRRDEMLQNPNETRRGNGERRDVQRPTTSIGDILSRKLVMRDDLDIGRQGEERVSLNQMLDRHRSGTPPPPRRRSDKNNGGGGGGGDSKSFFWKRKGFGFVHVSLPLSKQSKNRIQSLNLW